MPLSASSSLSSQNLETDVIIIGAGITGLTAGFLLTEAGKKVVIIDQAKIGNGDTGHTSAHLTSILDRRYYQFETTLGHKKAQAVYLSHQAGLDWIAKTVDQHKIDCDFVRVPGYLFAQRVSDHENEPGNDLDNKINELQKELQACHRLGIPVELADKIPLPFPTAFGLKFPRQAQFHPIKYLVALAQNITQGGGQIFEETPALEITSGIVKTPHGEIHAPSIIVATHAATGGGNLMHVRVAAYRSYVISAQLKNPPTERALFWDTEDPYHYIRQLSDSEWIIGGADHKTGQMDDTEQPYADLRRYADLNFGLSVTTHRWSGQVYESIDGLPYIGLVPGSKDRYLVTGMSGNGLTFGTAAGMILSQQILGKESPGSELYRPLRLPPFSSIKEFVCENKDFPLYFVKDRIESAPESPTGAAKNKPIPTDSATERDTSLNRSEIDLLHKGQGKILRIQGKNAAVFRDDDNQVHLMSSTCPHMGCHVHWNAAEKSWDCPCHGGRYDAVGNVIQGPALKGLAPLA